MDEDTRQNIALAVLEGRGTPESSGIVETREAKRRAYEERRLLVPFDTRVREGRLAPAEFLTEPPKEQPPPPEQQTLVRVSVRRAVQRMTCGRPRLERIAEAMLAEVALPHHERKLLPKLKARVKQYLEDAQGEAAQTSLRQDIIDMRRREMTWTQIAKQLRMTKAAVMKVALGSRNQ